MSNDNNVQSGTRTNFASRLLNKTMSERKKTGEIDLTTGDAAKFAVAETEKKETATTVSG